MGEYIYDQNAELICADIVDQDGAINAGVITADVGSVEIVISEPSLDEVMAYCLNGDPDVP